MDFQLIDYIVDGLQLLMDFQLTEFILIEFMLMDLTECDEIESSFTPEDLLQGFLLSIAVVNELNS